jgi:hypothetical protein
MHAYAHPYAHPPRLCVNLLLVYCFQSFLKLHIAPCCNNFLFVVLLHIARLLSCLGTRPCTPSSRRLLTGSTRWPPMYTATVHHLCPLLRHQHHRHRHQHQRLYLGIHATLPLTADPRTRFITRGRKE